MWRRRTQILVKKANAGELRASWECEGLVVLEAVKLGGKGEHTRDELLGYLWHCQIFSCRCLFLLFSWVETLPDKAAGALVTAPSFPCETKLQFVYLISVSAI